MGFSIPGLILVVTILAPNLLYATFPPRNVPQTGRDAGPVFGLLEQIGRVACLGLLVFSGRTLDEGASSLPWFVLACVSIAMYYAVWIRYFSHGRKSSLLLAPLGVVPIPLAIFPVLAFGFSALWSESPWFGLAVLLFAVGHVSNTWRAYRTTTST